MVGGAADDSAYLGLGLDNFAGGIGNDYANGGSGADILDGGYGNDTLDGGSGNDVMTGGFGSDIYYVDSTDDSVTEVDDANAASEAFFPLPPGVDPQSVGRSVGQGDRLHQLHADQLRREPEHRRQRRQPVGHRQFAGQ